VAKSSLARRTRPSKPSDRSCHLPPFDLWNTNSVSEDCNLNLARSRSASSRRSVHGPERAAQRGPRCRLEMAALIRVGVDGVIHAFASSDEVGQRIRGVHAGTE
jgi:hypothetical protein